jgi:hypothetical protein
MKENLADAILRLRLNVNVWCWSFIDHADAWLPLAAPWLWGTLAW